MAQLYKTMTYDPTDVKWEDDSFASGWSANNCSLTRDGDLAKLKLDIGYAEGWVQKDGLNIDASTYKYCIVCLKGTDRFFIEVYDGAWKSVTNGHETAPTEYDVKVYDLSGITNGTITETRLGVGDAEQKEAIFDFIIFARVQPQLTIENMVDLAVKQRESDLDEFNLATKYEESSPFVHGRHVRIWLEALKVFAGVIEEVAPADDGGRVTHVGGRCFGQKLLLATKSIDWTVREVSLAVKDLVADLSEVSFFQVETPSPTVNVTKSLRYEYLSDGLKDLAKQAGSSWEVKLGMGHDLRFRSRTSPNVPTSPVSIQEGVNVLRGLRKETDALRLYNKVTVIGGSRSNPDNDPDQYTEGDASNWVDDDPQVVITNDYTDPAAGKASVKRYGNPSLTISSFSTKFDLGSGGVDFSYFTHVRFHHKTLGITVSKQYDFYLQMEDTAGKVAKKKYLDTSQMLPTGWVEYNYALNDFAVDSGFNWSHIRYIRLKTVASSPPDGTICGTDWWDGLCFYTNNVIKTAVDGSSEFAHVREYVYKNEKLLDPAFAQEVANALLAVLKNKENRYRIPILGTAEVQAGMKISVNIPSHGLNGTYYVCEAMHKVSPGEGYVTEVVLEAPTLTLEDLLAQSIQRQIKRIERGGIP